MLGDPDEIEFTRNLAVLRVICVAGGRIESESAIVGTGSEAEGLGIGVDQPEVLAAGGIGERKIGNGGGVIDAFGIR